MRLPPLIVAGALAVLAAAPSGGQPGDPNLGRSLAATCANCHGTNGISVGEVASLAGRPKEELARKMQDFKAGRVPGTMTSWKGQTANCKSTSWPHGSPRKPRDEEARHERAAT